MEIQNDHRIVPVLGIMVDSVSVSRAVEISKTYLDNDYFNFIILAGAQLAMESQVEKETKKFTKIANLILPGDHNVEEAVNKASEGSFQEKYLDSILMLLADEKRHLCVLCDTQEQCEKVIIHLEEDYPGLKVDGVVFEETGEEEMEALVNTINGYFPDMVLPLVDLSKQKELLLAHKETLSTKLCISSETVYQHIFQEEKGEKDSPVIVKWLMKRLHLGKEAIENEFWQKLNEEREQEK
ncbi:MAG: WecB/TagA/CpsF family glycosyltransferase [Lachnospiraceae bacterium]|nr:WecB/TagA/CpsF family glycosyltransferase [Lachnospiraceae bacterium]